MSSYQSLTQSSQLTFDDEFNSFVSSPTGTVGWMTEYPYVGPNARELTGDYQDEFLSDSSVGTNPFSDKNGVLSITASKAVAGSNPYGLPYTSGIITSFKSLTQTYGYFEISAELPAGSGFWPSFYMLPTNTTNYTSELDVFETLGSTPNTIEVSTRALANGVWTTKTDTITVPNTTTGFNTFGVDWEPTTTTFYMNGQVIATMTTPAQMDVPMYMIAVLQVGDTNTAYPGEPNSSTVFPSSMQINYVRAYATANTIQVNGTAAIKTGAIDGTVLLDGKGDSGVSIALLNAAGTVIATATTTSNGSFTFSGLAAGDYQVRYTPPTGLSLAAGGPADTSSDLTAVQTLSDGQTLTLAAETILSADPGPSGGDGIITVGHGQTVNLTSAILAFIKPGTVGDTETITAIKATSGTVMLGDGGVVTYQAPASGTATLTYTVTDQHGDSATFSTGIVVDPGPSTATGSSSVVAGGTIALGAAIAALITPGIAGDTETITAVKTSGGSVSLGANGAISFTAPTATGTDTVTYTVVDEYGDSATGTYSVNVTAPPAPHATLASHTAILGPSYPAYGGGLGGVTVSLINSAGLVVATTVSGAGGGYYAFTGITPGTYQLGFSEPSGVVYQPGGGVNVGTGLTAPFTLTAGQSYIAPNANYVAAAAVTGSVVVGGAGQAGVAVTLLTTAGAVVATTTTASDGSFSFGQLEAGSYEVKYTAPSGKVLLSGPANSSTGLTAALTLSAGQTVTLATETLASTQAAATLTGSVTLAGAALAGVTVTLLNGSGGTVATTTTGNTGAFSFTGLTAGSYQVKYAPPPGDVLQSGPANSNTGLSAVVTLAAGQTLSVGTEALAAAPVAPASLASHTAILGPAYPAWGGGLGGVTVSLINSAGLVVATTVSGAGGGYYAFTGIAPGTYQLGFSDPTGVVLQPGGSVNVSTGLTAPFTLTAGQSYIAPNANYVAAAAITGSVVNNGVGQAGVTVNLLTTAGAVVATTTTANNGSFSFGQLEAGTYMAKYTATSGEVLESGPANSSTGLTATVTVAAGQALSLGTEIVGSAPAAPATLASHTAILGPAYPAYGGGLGGVTVSLINSAGTVVATTVSAAGSGYYAFVDITPGTYQLGFSDPTGVVYQPGGGVNVSTGLTAPFTLTAGQSYIAANANYVAAAVISGSVATGGIGQAGVTVTLLTTSGTVLSTTKTASNGGFSFGQLEAGTYEVKYTATSGEVLQSGPASNSTGLTSAVTVTAGQTYTLAAETLAYGTATIQSQVVHLNGPSDAAGGTGESGVTVSLLNAAGTVIATTTTNTSGGFSFSQLAAGTYQLKYTPPPGQTFIPGAPENTTTGLTAQFTLTAGQALYAPAGWLISTLTFNGVGTTLVAPAGGFAVTGNATKGKLTLGNGNQYVTLTGAGGNTITAGTGNDTIVLAGTGNTVTVGAGDSYIGAGSGNDTVYAAGGGVTIAAYGAGNVLDGGGLSFITVDGSANNKFVLNSAGQGLTTITGFNTAANNILDLQRTLAGTDIKADLSNLASLITATTTGSNTTLYVNPTGSGATAFAVLDGVKITVAQLQAAHEFSLS